MSTVFLRKRDESYLDMYDGVDTSQATFSESFDAGFRESIARGNSNSRAQMLRDAWDPFLKEIESKTGERLKNPAQSLNVGILDGGATHGHPQRMYNHYVNKVMDYIKNNEETLGEELSGLTHEFIIDRAVKNAIHESENYDEVANRSGSWKQGAARFAGAFVATINDPVVLQTMILGTAVNQIKNVSGMMLREAIIGGSTESLIQLEVMDWYKELGLPYSSSDFLRNVAASAALSAAFPLTFKIGKDTVTLTAKQAQKGYNALKGGSRSIGEELSDSARASEELLDTIESTYQNSPLEDTAEHVERVKQVNTAIRNDEAPDMPEPTSAPLKSELEKVANPEIVKTTQEIENISEVLEGKIKERNELLLSDKDPYENLKKQKIFGENADEAFDVDNSLHYKQLEKAYGESEYYQKWLKMGEEIDDLLKLRERTEAELKSMEVVPETAADPKPKVINSTKEVNEINDVIGTFKAKNIKVDAKTFQFKDFGDEFGVTERLQGVETWDPMSSGTVVVYEKLDGDTFIVDGHQRLALAKRLMNKNKDLDISLSGFRLRESDGITPEEAMGLAAVKNMNEGYANVLDMVKVLRTDPKLAKILPPRSAVVRQARAIMNFKSDEAYGMFVNDIVPPQYAQYVGRLIPEDEQLQLAAMKVLAKAKPENEMQASAMVREVLEGGTEQVEQTSLFGTELEAESFYFERAKVMDRAVKELKRDRSAFNTIVENQTKFESEGNKLARSANEQKIENDSRAIDSIVTLANRKGELSDDLSAAAKHAKRTGDFGEATERFVNAVRGSIGRGDFARQVLGDVGRVVDAPPQNGRIPVKATEEHLEGFDNPDNIVFEKQTEQMEADLFQDVDNLELEAIEVPSSVTRDLDGKDQVNFQSLRDMKDEIEKDKDILDKMGYCVK